MDILDNGKGIKKSRFALLTLGTHDRASLQFMDHFVGIDAREQRHGTQLFA